ncbi:TadE family type IV pilus minor pilin [Ornithinimicrobium cryptoxanthini]|uniref:Pilus assembly protein TadE n=1 Tax=Ornithinimicrobium cryptoxanthini TaxID=2934161 RepID=A0ABY4YIS2_9MICO|nr:TadE family type IV pilus minor pilin [Ornithinimicrobium cryptoxanthini]USQ76690.1 pilus assembly protein TadE [Ornithinimicrobium cryptoxanthini]
MEDDDAGMVTAELAIAIPTLVAVLVLCLSGLGLALDQIRCVDAARISVRAAARGEPVEVVTDLARTVAPAGAEVSVQRDGDRVTVTVTAAPRTRYLSALPRASATVEALLEPAARMGSP